MRSMAWVQFNSGLAELADADVSGASDEVVREEVLDLVTARNRLDAAIAERVGVFDRRGLSDLDAMRTTRSWLTAFGRLSQGLARTLLHRARLLAAMPALAEAAHAGTVSGEHLDKVDQLVERVGL